MDESNQDRAAGGILTIDLGALVENWRSLARRAAPAMCAAVVKADAYGCGTEPVVRALVSAGCEAFFVAHLSEGARVRQVAPAATIYVLNGLYPDVAAAYAASDLRPVLSSLAEIEEWTAFRAGSGWRGGSALHVDTGMNRLGLAMDEFAVVDVHGAGLTLVMSHLACADEPSHALNSRQIERFRAVRTHFPALPGSLANSSGVFLSREAHHDLVRPGLALYGGNPTPDRPNPMRQVVALQGRVLQVRIVPRGASVGYGATWTVQRDSRVAIVAIGYADGYLRSAGGGGGAAMVQGRRCRLVGRVSMDLLAVDVTDIEPAPERGDSVALLDDTITIDELAAHAGTISYEILTALGRRYARHYVQP